MATQQPFDWAGVIVGHWYVARPRGRGKGRNMVWQCVSECGVYSPFRTADLSAGATLSCEACRGGAAGRLILAVSSLGDRGRGVPSPPRVLPERELPYHQQRWSELNVMKQNTLNVKGDGALKDWANHAMPLIRDVIRRTGLGLEFGWTITPRDVHVYAHTGGRGNKPPVLMRTESEAERRVDVRVYPPEGDHWFDVSIQSGRTGDWRAVLGKVVGAVEYVASRPPEPPAPPPPPAPAPAARKPEPPPTHRPENGRKDAAAGNVADLLGAGIGRLEAMKSGIEAVIATARDSQAAAVLRGEVADREAALRAEAEPLAAEMDAVTKKVVAACDHARECRTRYEAAKAVAEKAHVELEWAERNEADVKALKDDVMRRGQPVLDRWHAVQAELAEYDRAEAERRAGLSKAGDLSVLLAALENLGK